MGRIFTIIGMCLLWLQKTDSQNGGKHKGFKLMLSDYLFDNYVQYLQDGREKLECAMLCVYTPACPSFAYQQDTGECFIYDRIILKDDSKSYNKSVSTFILKRSNEVSDHSVQSTTSNANVAMKALDSDAYTKSLTLEQVNQWWCTNLTKPFFIRMIIVDTDSSLVPQYDVRLGLDNQCSASGLATSSLCNSISTSNIGGADRFGFTFKNCTGIEMKAKTIYLTASSSEPTSLAFYSVSVYPELC
ncbi:hypothetical protein LOTGIDRAFT_173860 [Lottia gigantea]|uniref:Apple domain-containing protein n=1 Tax=Lottia gigantea TaxID=225164 RepID=V4A5C0_LOTGI|nr:hypothetical protein LOTGIDRAFT_173860 [Lottia gigantea]ESO99118.1 hypothetical protein LOTGIDRAFT_173860 [Lottia gigantea]